jgi:hypothetical protein
MTACQVECGLFMGLCYGSSSCIDGAQPDHQVEPNVTSARQTISHMAENTQHITKSSNRTSRRSRSSYALRQYLRPALIYVAALLLGLVYNGRFP